MSEHSSISAIVIAYIIASFILLSIMIGFIVAGNMNMAIVMFVAMGVVTITCIVMACAEWINSGAGRRK